MYISSNTFMSLNGTVQLLKISLCNVPRIALFRDITIACVCTTDQNKPSSLLSSDYIIESKSSIYLAATCTTVRRHPRDIPEDEERALEERSSLSFPLSQIAMRRDLFSEIGADSQHPSIAIIRHAVRLICISRVS